MAWENQIFLLCQDIKRDLSFIGILLGTLYQCCSRILAASGRYGEELSGVLTGCGHRKGAVLSLACPRATGAGTVHRQK